MPYKIAVCVPCAPEDRPLLPFCLRSIQAQTRVPDLIVVSLSSVQDPVKLVLDLSGIAVPIEYVYSPKALLPGGNRNLAAARAVELGADLLAFFDADDMMHPRRMEIIEGAFEKHPEITGLVHHFMAGPKTDVAIYRGEKEIPWEPILGIIDSKWEHFRVGTYRNFNIIKYVGPKINRLGYGMTATGHVTALASFWKETPFDETMHLGEDNHFCAAIVKSNKILAYSVDTLSLYMRSDFKDFRVGL